MSSINTIPATILELFVGNGRFTLSILVWLGLAWFVLRRLPALGPWTGALLFAGVAGVLVESALQRARR